VGLDSVASRDASKLKEMKFEINDQPYSSIGESNKYEKLKELRRAVITINPVYKTPSTRFSKT